MGKNNLYPVIICLLAGGFLFSCKSSGNSGNVTVDKKIVELEEQAEKGDTSALHQVLDYYEHLAPEDGVVVEEPLDEKGQPKKISKEELEATEARHNFYRDKLDYWIGKGVEMEDRVALEVAGMRLYYNNNPNAIEVLGKAAQLGSERGALYAGLAALNLGKGGEAMRYFQMAYDRGVPSAGWHLSRYYKSGTGVAHNEAKALEYLRQSAMLNYPEAVSEMRRIEPDNIIWMQKFDSIGNRAKKGR